MTRKSIAIDIGNTNVVIGLFSGGLLQRTRRHETAGIGGPQGVYAVLNSVRSGGAVQEGIISSVVPALTPLFRKALSEGCGIRRPLLVTSRTDTGVQIDIDRPEQLGADRIVNAAYGYHRYGGPLLLIDFGTATTLCNVSGDGRYIGGAILPGMRLGAESLVKRAAKLRKISFEGELPVMGRKTTDSMRIGIVRGHAGAVIHVAREMLRHMGRKTRVVATGGLAGFMAPHIPFIERVEPDLTLLGLQYILERRTAA